MHHKSKKPRLRYDDPDAELYEKRARNDLHLKSRFEAIFEKFGKDFGEVGDEIDMQTGKIVVDKGHINGMAHEQDLGMAINPSSQRLSKHRIATEDLGGSLRDRDAARSTVESTAGSLLGSDTDMEDVLSDPAVDLSNRDTNQTAASSSGKLSSGQCHISKHRILQAPKPDETPLRKLNVDSVLNRLQHRQITMYDSPTEPAWQVPPLPIDKIAQAQRPIPTSRWSEENEKRRSASPNLGSLWTPFRSRGPAKNEAAAIASRNGTSKVRRSSLPAITTKEACSGHAKHPIAKKAPSEAWTFREESLLQQLRTTTNQTFDQLVPYFPGRSSAAIAMHWSQKLVRGLSKHQEQWANNSDAAGTAIAANIDDADVDELQAYDYVFQPSNTVTQSKKIQEVSPNAFFSQREVPASPCPTAQVPIEGFPDSMRQHSRSKSPEVQVHSSLSVTSETPQKSHPAAKIHSYQRSNSTADAAGPVPQVVVADLAASSTGRALKARNRKEHISPNIATTASNTPGRSIDDLSEDELATPVNLGGNANLSKVLTGSKKSTASPKLQSPDLDSGSEDELSTLVQQKLGPK